MTITEILHDMGYEGATSAQTFEEVGLDSLDFVLMVQEVREKVGEVSDHDAARCETVGDLEKVIRCR